MPKADSVLSTQRKPAPVFQTDHQLRQQVEASIERLLSLLDDMDGDADVEDDREGEESEANECPVRSDWRVA